MEAKIKLKDKIHILIVLALFNINTIYAGSINSANSVVKVKKGKNVLNATGGKSIGELTNFFGDWLTTIGALIMLIGGVMFAFGYTNDDADKKTRALQVMAAGGIVAALKTFKWI